MLLVLQVCSFAIHFMSDRPNHVSVYKVLASGDGARVEDLLRRLCFDMVGMVTEQNHFRVATCNLKVFYEKKDRLVARVTANALSEDDLGGSNWASDYGDEMHFDAVLVVIKSLGTFTKKQTDVSGLTGALKDLGDYQFRQRHPDAPTYVYNLPVPDRNRDMPWPCIVVTPVLRHTTICWKEVIVDGFKTLAIAHVDATGFSYKKFHKMVQNSGTTLQVPKKWSDHRDPTFENVPMDGCWGPLDYFEHDKVNKQRSDRTLTGTGVVIGVWDMGSRSWQLFAQVRRKMKIKSVTRIYPAN